MYKIGIIGHEPDRWGSEDHTASVVADVIDLLVHQYCHLDTDLIFHVSANIGIGHMAAQHCMSSGIKYHLHLPMPIEKASAEWFDSQKEDLLVYYKHADGITISNFDKGTMTESIQASYAKIVDVSSVMIYFWRHIKQGNTAYAIKHAFSINKIALNGLDNLKLITRNDFIK